MERSTVMMKHSSSSCCSTLPNYMSFPHKTTLRDASFNSYLIRPEHHDHPNNTNIQADDSEISIFDAQKYFNESSNVVDAAKVLVTMRVSPVTVNNNNNNNNNFERISEQRRSSADVSSAALPRFSSASSLDGYCRNYRARSFNATPTASSEASWNSQTGLLSNPPGAIAVSMRTPKKKKGSSSSSSSSSNSSSKWLFGRSLKCPCSGKKSVQVEEKLSSVSEPKTPARLYNKKLQTHKPIGIISTGKSFPSDSEIIPNTTTRRISAENRFPSLGQRVIASGRPYSTDATGFTFPVLNQTPSMKLVLNSTTNLPSNTNPSLQDPRRESLEIFQPSSDEITVSRKSTDLDLQNRMLVSRQSFTFPASPPSRTRMMSITDDDVASDTSSDLFEIESFSTQTTSYPMYNNHRRDSLDEASSFNTRRLADTSCRLMYCSTTRGSLDEMPVVTPSTAAAAEWYEPSEASIDWSVTTAEGLDRGSVMNLSVTASEVDDVRMSGGGGGSNKKKGSGMLLSCRSEKAVSVVGPNPVKCVAGSGTRHVSSRTQNVSNNKPPLVARSQSDPLSLSLPFAT